GGLLVDRPDVGVVLASASFAVTLTLTADGTESTTWALQLVPPTGNSVVESDAVSAAHPTEQTYVDLAFALALQAISTGLAADTPFKNVYGLLTSAGLTVAVTGNTGFGLNVGGWRSFVADPTNYLANRAQALLSDPSNRDTFFAVVWQILGLPTFTVPTPVL